MALAVHLVGLRREARPAKRGADWPLLQLKEFFANFSCCYEKTELRIPIARHISHTTCLFEAHLEEDGEAVSVVEGVDSLLVEVCSSSAQLLQEL